MFYQPDPDDRTVHDFGFERNGHAARDGKPIRDRSPAALVFVSFQGTPGRELGRSRHAGGCVLHAGERAVHHGQALIPNAEGHPVVPGSNGGRFDQLELLTVGDTGTPDVTYGALQGPGSVDAAVRLWCNNNGGTADSLTRIHRRAR